MMHYYVNRRFPPTPPQDVGQRPIIKVKMMLFQKVKGNFILIFHERSFYAK
jgi:hypothetical protein